MALADLIEKTKAVSPELVEAEKEEDDEEEEEVEEEEAEAEEETTDVKSEDKKIEEKEEQVTLSKNEYEKLTSDLGNYRKATIESKVKTRTLGMTPPADEDDGGAVEKKVWNVLYQKNQNDALRSVLNPKSEYYIPELDPDDQYNEIISYLDGRLDKSSTETIIKGLKRAVLAWKYENNRLTVDDVVPKAPKATTPEGKAGALATRTAPSKSHKPVEKVSDKKISRFFQKTSIKDWYN